MQAIADAPTAQAFGDITAVPTMFLFDRLQQHLRNVLNLYAIGGNAGTQALALCSEGQLGVRVRDEDNGRAVGST